MESTPTNHGTNHGELVELAHVDVPTGQGALSDDMDGKSSKFIGVSWHKGAKHWRATIKHLGKKVFLGAYKDEMEGARAFDMAAIKYRGTSARTNFPISEYGNVEQLIEEGQNEAADPVKRPRGRPRKDGTIGSNHGTDTHYVPPKSSGHGGSGSAALDPANLPFSPALQLVQNAIADVMNKPVTHFMDLEPTANHEEVLKKQEKAMEWVRLKYAPPVKPQPVAVPAVPKTPTAPPKTPVGRPAGIIGKRPASAPAAVGPAKVPKPSPPVSGASPSGKKYKGVNWVPDKNKWRAQLGLSQGKKQHIGYFKTEEEAARAYETAAAARRNLEKEASFQPQFTGAQPMLFPMPLAPSLVPKAITDPTKRGPGRPKGSTNKPKTQSAVSPAQSVAQPLSATAPNPLKPHQSDGASAGAGYNASQPSDMVKLKWLGVYLIPKTQRFRAMTSEVVNNNKRKVRIGDFDTEEEAARAYDRYVIQVRGVSVKTNFPTTDYADFIGEYQSQQTQHYQQYGAYPPPSNPQPAFTQAPPGRTATPTAQPATSMPQAAGVAYIVTPAVQSGVYTATTADKAGQAHYYAQGTGAAYPANATMYVANPAYAQQGTTYDTRGFQQWQPQYQWQQR